VKVTRLVALRLPIRIIERDEIGSERHLGRGEGSESWSGSFFALNWVSFTIPAGAHGTLPLLVFIPRAGEQQQDEDSASW
jgi:hypothetical protein